MTKLISTSILIAAFAGSLITAAVATKSQLPSIKDIQFSKPIIADQMWPNPKSGKPPAAKLG